MRAPVKGKKYKAGAKTQGGNDKAIRLGLASRHGYIFLSHYSPRSQTGE
jgi:hypothetical protein